MKILYITHENANGGANLSLLGIIDSLSDNNQIVVLVRKSTGFLVNELKKRNVQMVIYPYFCWIFPICSSGILSKIEHVLHYILNLANYIFAIGIQKKLEMSDIDIIHTNSMVVNFGGILSRKYQISHIWHIREFVIEHLGYSSIYSWNKTFQFMNKYSDNIIVISEDLKKRYQKVLDKIVLIHNGISPQNSCLKEVFTKGKVNFIITGTICAEKGQHIAVEAVRLLVTQEYKNFHLYIAGSGEVDRLNKIIEDNQLKKYITLCGHVYDMCTFRKDMDVELVCSKREGFGRISVEAMMASIPVIGANTGGTLDIVKDNYNGLLYAQGDAHELAQKMSMLMENPLLIEQLGKNAHKFAMEKFTIKNSTDKLYNLYSKYIK